MKKASLPKHTRQDKGQTKMVTRAKTKTKTEANNENKDVPQLQFIFDRIERIEKTVGLVSEATVSLIDRVEALRLKAQEQKIAEKEEKVNSVPDITIADIPYGIPFYRIGSTNPTIKVKPTSYLLNSILVQENLQRGNVLIMNTKLYTVFFVDASETIRTLA